MWRRNVLARVCDVLLLLTATVCAGERGWLIGTAAFFGESGFVGDAERAKVVVACKGRQTIIKADERGDYGVQLDPCQYQLVEVVGPDGKKLQIHSRQARTFVITGGGTTRFDVMISR